MWMVLLKPEPFIFCMYGTLIYAFWLYKVIFLLPDGAKHEKRNIYFCWSRC